MAIRINHNRNTALERSVKSMVGGGGLNRFYVATTLAIGNERFFDDRL